VAVVTGAGQGLGRAFALDLARRGWQVAVVDLNGDRADAVAAEITKADGVDGMARGFTCDVSDRSHVSRLAADVTGQLGQVAGLVNNAAIFSALRMGSFEDIEPGVHPPDEGGRLREGRQHLLRDDLHGPAGLPALRDE